MAVQDFSTQRIYAKKESAFNDSTYQSLAAANAIRVRTFSLTPKHNHVPSKDKTPTPDVISSNPRMETTGWQAGLAWKPSGTIGTGSEAKALFEAFFGSMVAAGGGSGVTTTVSASPTPTVTGFTVASATGLAVGDVIVVTMAAGHREATRITAIATNALTVSPALTAAPATGAAVVAGVSYKLITAAPGSLALGNFMTSKKEGGAGSWVDAIELNFGKEEEVMATFSGRCAQYLRNGNAGLTDPTTQTFVGTELNGLVGKAIVNSNIFKVTAVKLSLANNLAPRVEDIGDAYATEIFRSSKRDFKIDVSFYVDDHRIVDLSTTPTKAPITFVLGSANGAMLACVCPNVLYEMVGLPSGQEGAAIVTASGQAYGVNGNDAITLAEL